MEVVVLVVAAAATTLATGLGVLPVAWLGDRAAALGPLLWGFAAGVMTIAAVAGLLLPALDDNSDAAAAAGVAAGVLFLAISRYLLEARPRPPGSISAQGTLVFLVLFVHSLPEGFAIGTAYASDTDGLALFVIAAIALQNVPEGTAVAIPMAAAGQRARRQFWAACATSAPQPVGALLAYALVSVVEPLLPFSFGFAAGAMLALVASDLGPEALRRGRPALGAAGIAGGAAVMLALSAVLGVG